MDLHHRILIIIIIIKFDLRCIVGAFWYLAVDLQIWSKNSRRTIEVVKQTLPLFVKVTHKVNLLHTYDSPIQTQPRNEKQWNNVHHYWRFPGDKRLHTCWWWGWWSFCVQDTDSDLWRLHLPAVWSLNAGNTKTHSDFQFTLLWIIQTHPLTSAHQQSVLGFRRQTQVLFVTLHASGSLLLPFSLTSWSQFICLCLLPPHMLLVFCAECIFTQLSFSRCCSVQVGFIS